MYKRMFLAVLMIAALLLGTSCGATKDSASDGSTVIIEVAGTTIPKSKVETVTNNVMSYMQYMYSMYGMTYDATDADTISQAQDSAIQWLIQSTVVAQKVKEAGMDVFTDAELAELQKAADDTYQGYYDTVQKSYLADTTLTGDDLTKAVTEKMTELGYPDQASLLEDQKTTKSEDKLKESIVKDVTVTDADIQSEYDSKVSDAKTSYETNLSQYASDVSSGALIYYRPAGYRYVKNLLIQFTSDDSAAITALQSQVDAKTDDLDTNASMIAALPTDAGSITDDVQDRLNRLNTSKTQLEADIADLNAQIETAKEKAYTDLQAKVDEVSAKIAAGEDFDALLTEYGEDTGMQSEPAKTEGYLVCAGDTQYVTEFTDASMALANVGDISAAFRSQYGIHFVKYVSDVTEGAVPLADIKDQIGDTLLTTKKDDLYNNTVTQWVTDANAKIYKDRL